MNDWIQTPYGWFNTKTHQIKDSAPADVVQQTLAKTRPQTVRKPVQKRKMNGLINGVMWSNGKRYTGSANGHYYINGVQQAEFRQAQQRTRQQQAQNNRYGQYKAKQQQMQQAEAQFGEVVNQTLSPSHAAQAIVDAAKGDGTKALGGNKGLFGPGGSLNQNGENGDLSNLVFDFVAPVAAVKSLKAVTNAAKTAKDAAWAVDKTFIHPIDGGTFKYKAKSLADFLKHPTRNRRFFQNYNGGRMFSLSDKGITKANPLFDKIAQKYGWSPKVYFADYEDPAITAAQVDKIMRGTKQYAKVYTDRINYIRNSGNKALQTIAETSPQYVDRIYQDLLNGNVKDTESYVKNLIGEANSFEREMRQPGYDELDEDDFLRINGQSKLGSKTATMDVGDSKVANGYGPITGYYQPNSSNLQLEGPVETWWSQRFPSGLPAGTKLNTYGMHTGDNLQQVINSTAIPGALPQDRVAYQFSRHLGVPKGYGWNSTHMTFVGRSGDSIWPAYDVSFDPDDTIYNEGLGLYGNDLDNGVYTWQSKK